MTADEIRAAKELLAWAASALGATLLGIWRFASWIMKAWKEFRGEVDIQLAKYRGDVDSNFRQVEKITDHHAEEIGLLRQEVHEAQSELGVLYERIENMRRLINARGDLDDRLAEVERVRKQKK